jgi:ABC-type multidrug transport system fused ATPase/permease subunit
MKRYIEAVRDSASILPKGDKRKIFVVTVVQVALSFLDLIGVALVGIVGAISITGIQSQQPGQRTEQVLSFLHLGNLDFYKQVIVLSILSALFLVGRTILSMVFTRKYLRFLGNRSALITSTLFSRLISRNILEVQKRNAQETLFLLTEGVRRITVGVLGNFVFLVADLSLLVVLTLGLLVLDPIVAIVTFFLFGSVAVLLHFAMAKKSQRLGRYNSEISILSNKHIVEAINSYREMFVRDRKSFYTSTIEAERYKLSLNDAHLAFMPMISKYVLESAVVVGAFVIAGLQFALNDARHAIATLAIFMAAGSRIGPALMRVQQGLIQIGIALGSAEPTLNLAKELDSSPPLAFSANHLELEHRDFVPTLKVSGLSFAYPNASSSGVNGVSFELRPGQSLAIVGSSGAGKTTLVDLILGILKPSLGEVLIGGLQPADAIRRWPGGISYVPQDVAIIDGTIRENICMGFPVDQIPDTQLWKALDDAKLLDFVKSLPDGLDSEIGDHGSKISGGERQRVGIARALLSNPKLLVLDEATSSLDGSTEAEISESIQLIKGKVTVVMIAHRLSTVRNADLVMYLENGRIIAIGTFNEVREKIPNFDAQARLMGL